ncbi:hypothetical protein [Paractinoplanes lichenicola]|uniref:Uncharacterized protein n=1 Tax=Paractinoplanes lichenicola TaxID=2802976 RepID=A0ABS1VY41_9ACTN|nr:hypothetical protein [Actinoplanes lichenicola]MBL7259395.1 hypothetical protein [Actinoplanes lichenicola]
MTPHWFLPPNLQHLRLSGDALTTMPEVVREQRSLRVLKMSSTAGCSAGVDGDLHRLTPRFGGEVNRVVLAPQPERGQITALPPWLFEMPGLEWIDVTGQRVAEVSSAGR